MNMNKPLECELFDFLYIMTILTITIELIKYKIGCVEE